MVVSAVSATTRHDRRVRNHFQKENCSAHSGGTVLRIRKSFGDGTDSSIIVPCTVGLRLREKVRWFFLFLFLRHAFERWRLWTWYSRSGLISEKRLMSFDRLMNVECENTVIFGVLHCPLNARYVTWLTYAFSLVCLWFVKFRPLSLQTLHGFQCNVENSIVVSSTWPYTQIYLHVNYTMRNRSRRNYTQWTIKNVTFYFWL